MMTERQSEVQLEELLRGEADGAISGDGPADVAEVIIVPESESAEAEI